MPVDHDRPELGGSSPPVETQVVRLLFELGARFRAHMEQVAASVDLSPMQARALHHLGQPCPMGEVAERLGCDASNVTGIVDRLEQATLVERRADPADRRRRLLVTTPRGQAVREEVHRRVQQDHPILRGLDPEQRRTLRDLLQLALDAAPAPVREAAR